MILFFEIILVCLTVSLTAFLIKGPSCKKAKITTDVFGRKVWKNSAGEYHREDGPAIEYVNGDKEYYINGKHHRTDGPALEYSEYKDWRIEGVHHREDGPAVESANGNKFWYLYGKLHRLDGPAIEFPNGYKEWWINGERQYKDVIDNIQVGHQYDKKVTEKELIEDDSAVSTVDSIGTKLWKNLNGKFHRIDGPAIERFDGTKFWYQNGKLHREDGPAVENINGAKYWYQNGNYHREDGPAIECADGAKAWYINGKKLTEQQFIEKKSTTPNDENSVLTVDSAGTKRWKNSKGEYHRTDGPAIEVVNGDKHWRVNGKRHREDGPAIERSNGDKEWWVNGKRHKEDGPAIECVCGYKAWHLNGVIHRTDGPAVEAPDGYKEYWLNGKSLTKQQFIEKTSSPKTVNKTNKKSDSTMIVDEYGTKWWRNKENKLHRTDGPAVIKKDGYKSWWIHGKKHREDGPAIERPDGTKFWYIEGKTHREDGPAIEWNDGRKEWRLKGKLLTKNQFDKRVGNSKKVDKASKSKMIVDTNGDKRWVNEKGDLHRVDGPAIESTNGTKYWHQNGKLHRINGPAVEYGDGTKEWWLNNKKVTEQEVIQLKQEEVK